MVHDRLTVKHIQALSDDKTKATCSFVSTAEPRSHGVIGIAPLNAAGNDINLSPGTFRVNPEFVSWLSEFVASEAHRDPVLEAMAAAMGEGHLHIGDDKNPPPYGRIPYPEDIIGTVRVTGARIVDGTFTPMREAYRPVTANGIVKLSEYLQAKAVQKLNS
ncbi:hypothetical protein PYCC9005_001471 [Savitreella phatthalungensis]